jgi:hypothetical protein
MHNPLIFLANSGYSWMIVPQPEVNMIVFKNSLSLEKLQKIIMSYGKKWENVMGKTLQIV